MVEMLSRNNFSEKIRQMDEKHDRFSIRKLTVGAASVMIGAFFIGLAGQTVHADTNSDQAAAGEKTEQVAASEVKNEDSNAAEDQQSASQENNAASAKATEQKSSNEAQTQSADKAANNTEKTAATALKQSKAVSRIAATTSANNSTASANDTTTVTDSADEEVHVTFPDGNGNTKRYRFTYKQNITGTKDSNGNITWNKTDISAKDLNDVLANTNFIDETGDNLSGHSLPKLDGYVPVITNVVTMSSSQYKDAALDLHTKLNNELDKKTFNNELLAYSVSAPVRTAYYISFYKAIQENTDSEVDLYLPGNDNDTKGDGSASYYKTLSATKLNGYIDDNGNKVWDNTEVNIPSFNLSDVLAGSDWTNNSTGRRGNSIPDLAKILKDYKPVVTTAKVAYDTQDKADADELFDTLNKEVKADGQTIPGFTSNKPLRAIYNIHFVKKTPDDYWEKTGETKTYTQTVRTWYQYSLEDNKGDKLSTYTFTYRKTTPSNAAVGEKKLTLVLDEYKNSETGATEWRIDPSKSSSLNDLLASDQIAAIPGYHLAIKTDSTAKDSDFANAISQNKGNEAGSEIAKILGVATAGDQTSASIAAMINNQNGVFATDPELGDKVIDVIYVADQQKIQTKIIDQDTNEPVWESGSFTSPTDWTWFEGAGAQLPKGYHEGTKQGNPIPNLDFKTGKFYVDGKEVNGVDLPVGSEDITFVYYVQKNAQPTSPSTPDNPTQPTNEQPTTPAPVNPETPVTPSNPTQPTEASQPTNAPTLPQDNQDQNKSNGNSDANDNGDQDTNNGVETVRPLASAKSTGNAKTEKLAAKSASANNSTKTDDKNALPQTGEKQSDLGLIGLALAAMVGIFGLADRRKKN